MKKITAVSVLAAALAATAVIAGGHLVTLHGTFTGGQALLTNGNERVALVGVYLSSATASNKQIRVCNLPGYTNAITAATATLELEYKDSGGAICLEPQGVLILDTTITNAAKYTIYRMNTLQ